jgi:formylmethanofuran dehydrogenase subunit E
MTKLLNAAEFRETVDFHGCYCLDIAMGYRVANALVREMGSHMVNMKNIVAHVGTHTCAIDAIQKIAGCTFGKRNLYFLEWGKPVYILQHTPSGEAVRCYVHYWDKFDHGDLRALKQKNKQEKTAESKQALQDYLDSKIENILAAPEEHLFRLTHCVLPEPEKVGKFESVACDNCGEYVKKDLRSQLGEQWVCQECFARKQSA